jgi:L-threonylcarbamoyladenylate synthase
VSPTTAADVRADLDGDVDVVLDGGPCVVGVESTIVDCSSCEPVVVRLGGVTRERIEELLGHPVAVRSTGEIAAPGTHAAHYAPDARVVVVDDWDEGCSRASVLLAEGRGVGVLGLAPVPDLPGGAAVLGAPGSADEYARLLYLCLRDADRRGLDVVLAVAPAERGLGAAVADRLRRAAAGSGAGRTATGSSR